MLKIRIVLQIELKSKLLTRLLKKLYKVDTNLQIGKKTNLKKNNVYSVEITDNAREILEDLDVYSSSKGLLDHPGHELVDDIECVKAYLAGVFLAYGSCNNPNKANYHLELSLPEESYGEYIIKLIGRNDIEAKMVERRKRYIKFIFTEKRWRTRYDDKYIRSNVSCK